MERAMNLNRSLVMNISLFFMLAPVMAQDKLSEFLGTLMETGRMLFAKCCGEDDCSLGEVCDQEAIPAGFNCEVCYITACKIRFQNLTSFIAAKSCTLRLSMSLNPGTLWATIGSQIDGIDHVYTAEGETGSKQKVHLITIRFKTFNDLNEFATNELLNKQMSLMLTGPTGDRWQFGTKNNPLVLDSLNYENKKSDKKNGYELVLRYCGKAYKYLYTIPKAA